MIDWDDPSRATVEEVEVELARIMAGPPNGNAMLQRATIEFLTDWLKELRDANNGQGVDKR